MTHFYVLYDRISNIFGFWTVGQMGVFQYFDIGSFGQLKANHNFVKGGMGEKVFSLLTQNKQASK